MLKENNRKISQFLKTIKVLIYTNFFAQLRFVMQQNLNILKDQIYSREIIRLSKYLFQDL